MKKISRILMCASLLLGFAACSDSDSGDDGDNNGTQLAAPVLAQSSVEETAFTVTWQAVEHANVYAYSLDGGAEATTSETSARLSGLNPGYGIYGHRQGALHRPEVHRIRCSPDQGDHARRGYFPE